MRFTLCSDYEVHTLCEVHTAALAIAQRKAIQYFCGRSTRFCSLFTFVKIQFVVVRVCAKVKHNFAEDPLLPLRLLPYNEPDNVPAMNLPKSTAYRPYNSAERQLLPVCWLLLVTF